MRLAVKVLLFTGFSGEAQNQARGEMHLTQEALLR
jgi:hypothetical protein